MGAAGGALAGKIGAVVAVLLILGLAGCGSSSEGDSQPAPKPPLVGVGSSLIDPVMAKWTETYERKSGVVVDYRDGGTGIGVGQVARKGVDFGTQDAPITPNQYSESTFIGMLPWAMTGVAVVYNVKGIPDGRLKLNGDVLARIVLGEVDRWNDPRVAKLNPDLRLPSTRIAVIDRSEESAEDYVLSNYLEATDKEYDVRSGTTRLVDVPGGTTVRGPAAAKRAVATKNGALGFLALPEALAEGFAIARIESPGGKFVAPTVATITSGAENVIDVGPNTEVGIGYEQGDANDAYPLVTFDYAIVKIVNGRAADLKRFLAYAISPEAQAMLPALHFAPLPKKLVDMNRQTIRNIYAG